MLIGGEYDCASGGGDECEQYECVEGDQRRPHGVHFLVPEDHPGATRPGGGPVWGAPGTTARAIGAESLVGLPSRRHCKWAADPVLPTSSTSSPAKPSPRRRPALSPPSCLTRSSLRPGGDLPACAWTTGPNRPLPPATSSPPCRLRSRHTASSRTRHVAGNGPSPAGKQVPPTPRRSPCCQGRPCRCAGLPVQRKRQRQTFRVTGAGGTESGRRSNRVCASSAVPRPGLTRRAARPERPRSRRHDGRRAAQW